MPIRSIGDLRAWAGPGWESASDEDLISSYSKAANLNPMEVANQLGYDAGTGGMSAKRLSSSIDSYQANLYGLGEAVAGGLGLDRAEGALGGRRRANEFQADVANWRAKQMGAIDSYKDVNSLGDAGNYLAGLAIQSAPYLGEAAVGGVAGRALGLGTKAALAAGAAATYPSAVGDVLANQREQAGQTDLAAAAALGVPYAAANALGLEGALARGRLMKSGIAALDNVQGVKGLAARGAATGVKTGASEGLGETFQEGMNQFGRMAVDPNAELFSPDAIERYKESFIGGAALGGVGGAATGWRRTIDPTKPHDLLSDRPAAGLESPTSYPLVPVGERGLSVQEAPYVEPTRMPQYSVPTDLLLPAPVEQRTTQDYPGDPIVVTPGGTVAHMSQLSGSQPDVFGGPDVFPGQGLTEQVEEPLAPSTDIGALFEAYPEALVRTEYGQQQVAAALRQANGGKYNAQLSRFVPEFTRAIEQGPEAVDALIAKYDTNRSTLQPAVFETAAQMAVDFQSRLTNAQAVGGMARAQPGMTVGQAPVSNTTEQQMRQRNQQAVLGQQLASEQARLAGAIADTDARVAGGQQQRTQQERLQAIEQSLQGAADAKNGRNRAIKALRRAGFRNTALSAQEQAYIKRHFELAEATNDLDAPLPSTPNEMGEVVPERKPKGAPQKNVSKKPSKIDTSKKSVEDADTSAPENRPFRPTSPPSTDEDLAALEKAKAKRERKTGKPEQVEEPDQSQDNKAQGSLFTKKGEPTAKADQEPEKRKPSKSVAKAKMVEAISNEIDKYKALIGCLRA